MPEDTQENRQVNEKTIGRRAFLRGATAGAAAGVVGGVVGGEIAKSIMPRETSTTETKPSTIPFLPLSPEDVKGPRTPREITESTLFLYDPNWKSLSESEMDVSKQKKEQIPKDQVQINEITTQNGGKVIEIAVPVEQIAKRGDPKFLFNHIRPSIERKTNQKNPLNQTADDISSFYQIHKMIGPDKRMRFYLNAGGIPKANGDSIAPSYVNMIDLDPRGGGIGYDPGEYTFNASFVNSKFRLEENAYSPSQYDIAFDEDPSFDINVRFKNP